MGKKTFLSSVKRIFLAKTEYNLPLDHEVVATNREFYKGMREENLIERYKVIREYIKHEDNLLNWRMTWSLTLQSVLGTVFVFIINTHFDAANTFEKDWTLFAISIFVCFIGTMTSHWSYRSIRAAIRSISVLRQYIPQEVLRQHALPQFTSAGEKESLERGSSLAVNLPRTMRVVWLALLVVDFIIVVNK